MELPFAARYVEDSPAANARELIAPPLFALLERAEQLLLAIAEDVEEARSMLPDLERLLQPSLAAVHSSRSNSAK